MPIPYFGVPFATSGDLLDGGVVPVGLQPDGSVSYTLGWGPDYELEDTQPGYKPVGRKEMNTMFNAVTSAVGEIQFNGFPLYRAAAAPYPINAIVRHNDVNWRSTVTNNTTTPGIDISWSPVSGQTTLQVTGTATAMAVAPSPALPAYSIGQRLPVRFNASSTPLTTINVSALGAKSLRQYNSAGVKIAAVTATGQISDIEYDGTDWVVINPLPEAIVFTNQGVRGSFSNLRATCTGSNANYAMSADLLTVASSSGACIVLQALSLTLNSSATASPSSSGMATGVTNQFTWYAVYVWHNPTSGLTLITGDVSFTAPNPPGSGFTHWARIGSFFTDSTANSKFPLAITQRGVAIQYTVATPRVISSGSTGSASTLIATPTTTLVPPTAVAIMIAPRTNGGAGTVTVNHRPSATSSTAFVVASGTASVVTAATVRMLIESATIYYGSDLAGGTATVSGWEDQL